MSKTLSIGKLWILRPLTVILGACGIWPVELGSHRSVGDSRNILTWSYDCAVRAEDH